MLTTALLGTFLLASVADEPRFQQAQKLYTELEYEAALEQFVALVAENRPSSEQSLLHAWVGMCHAGIGDMSKAEQSFVRGLELDPDLKLPVQASPKINGLFAKLQAKARETSAVAKESSSTTDTGDATGGSDSSTASVAGESQKSPGLSALFIGGAGAAALGAASVLGGAVLSGLAFTNLTAAVDQGRFQDEAQASLDSANTWMTGASICYGIGAVLFGVGTVLATVDVVTTD
ncbi:MAG: hypothetical protein ABIJ09_23325 [Pseudomonadota bacterium]